MALPTSTISAPASWAPGSDVLSMPTPKASFTLLRFPAALRPRVGYRLAVSYWPTSGPQEHWCDRDRCRVRFSAAPRIPCACAHQLRQAPRTNERPDDRTFAQSTENTKQDPSPSPSLVCSSLRPLAQPPAIADSIIATSIFRIVIIASKARFAALRSLPMNASVNTLGVICHDTPHLSLHHPHSLVHTPDSGVGLVGLVGYAARE
jgi:hypothetical protein